MFLRSSTFTVETPSRSKRFRVQFTKLSLCRNARKRRFDLFFVTSTFLFLWFFFFRFNTSMSSLDLFLDSFLTIFFKIELRVCPWTSLKSEERFPRESDHTSAMPTSIPIVRPSSSLLCSTSRSNANVIPLFESRQPLFIVIFDDSSLKCLVFFSGTTIRLLSLNRAVRVRIQSNDVSFDQFVRTK